MPEKKKKKERKVVNLVRDDKKRTKRAYAETFNISKASHPIACVFQVGFKIAAALTFLFMPLFTRSSVQVFVTSMLLCCVDFWVTKNITGRLLIGMRWWTGGELNTDDVVNPDEEEAKKEAIKNKDKDDGQALKNLELEAIKKSELELSD
jgi:Eukaryotic protein of unknown function (DUF846)